jgi:long-chain acyl-CoA synthetase
MDLINNFNKTIERSIVSNWDYDALTDYKGATLQFKDVARKIEKMHIMMEQIGVRKGDKIAICGRNSAHWGVAFLATLTYGAVAVPILHEFNAEQIHNIVNHSESRLLFVGDVVAKSIDPEQMPGIEGIVYLPDFSVFMSRSNQLVFAREHLNELFGQKYPKSFRKTDVNYYEDDEEELALINYTSGTTGFSKGVMLPYRTLTGNVNFCIEELGNPHLKPHSSMLSILPMAHMYGMAIEFLFPFSFGIHLFFLTRLPSPAIIAQAFADVKPTLVVSVPLVIEKIIRKRVFPKIQNNVVRLLLNMPVISKKVKQKICEQVYEAFGGNAYEVIIGGAALNKEVEAFLHSIEFPYTVGYGTTECAPLISYQDWKSYAMGSCGRPVSGMEVRIQSRDPQSAEGEIITRGRHVMLGYYKNEEATREAIDSDGWYHTGDLGTMDADGNIFIRGRKKNMLLSSNGQNVYPEEIEDKLNSMAIVSESIVVQEGDKFIALVHPDYDEAKAMGFTQEDVEKVMEQNRQDINAVMPAYSRLSAIRIHEEEFAKTPKKSIKRYLYQNIR